MLSLASLGAIAAAVLASAFISGIFGMAGGMILLGVLLLYLDVVAAMMLFGTIQAAGSAWRVVTWIEHVRWSIVWRYLVGSTVMFIIMRYIEVVPNKAMVYLGLGLIPFAMELLPQRLAPDITRRGMPYFSGALLLALQLIAGAPGVVLDMFFQKSGLDRKTIVGTKAVTQVSSHFYRIAYFGSFVGGETAALPWWMYAMSIALAVGATHCAGRVLEGMTDSGFRTWSRRVYLSVSTIYLLRGTWLLVSG